MIRAGLFLSAQHPPQAFTTAEVVRQCLEQTALARDAGFDLVMAGQHFVSEPFAMLQSVPLLARVAAEAGEMRVGSGIVLLTLLNPVEVAENAATLDAITEGRYVLGVGYGYRTEENEAFALPERRIPVFEAKLDVVRRLLAGEEVTAEGHGYRLDAARLSLRPLQDPLPIWLAANSDRMVRRAARLGDAWLLNPHTRLDELERQAALFRAARDAAGLQPPAETPIIKELLVGADDTAAMRAARPFLEKKYEAYVRWGQSEVLPEGDSLDQAWDELSAGGRFVVGGPETCLRILREHVERLGVDTILLRFQWPGMPQALVLDSMRRFAEDVWPALRAAT
jgi:alkanesulfonate monooxygenase SsuD/methylene tetrahydromethanopterin reductase-like flavin-dependent oxidoreductase (luciferase family)